MGRSPDRSDARRRSRSSRRFRSPERGRRRSKSPSRSVERHRRRSPSRSLDRSDRHRSGPHRSRRSRSRSHRRRSRSPRRRSPSYARSHRSRSRRCSPSPKARDSWPPNNPEARGDDESFKPAVAASKPEPTKPRPSEDARPMEQGHAQLSVNTRDPPRWDETNRTPGSVESTPLRPRTPTIQQQQIVPEDPVAKRRRERRHEAHHVYLKSATEQIKAQAKLANMEVELQMAELWLEYVGKSLGDVGRRTELQDWKFKKIDEGVDLTEEPSTRAGTGTAAVEQDTT